MNPRVLGGLAAIGLIASLSGVASAAPPQDSVTGSGTVTPNADVATYLRFTVSAHSGPDGQKPDGSISFRDFDPAAAPYWPGGNARSADFVCMLVTGADAVIVAEFKGGDRPFGPDYPYLALLVRDGGKGRGAAPDLALATGFNQTDCGILMTLMSYVTPLERGNVEVRDAKDDHHGRH